LKSEAPLFFKESIIVSSIFNLLQLNVQEIRPWGIGCYGIYWSGYNNGLYNCWCWIVNIPTVLGDFKNSILQNVAAIFIIILVIALGAKSIFSVFGII